MKQSPAGSDMIDVSHPTSLTSGSLNETAADSHLLSQKDPYDFKQTVLKAAYCVSWSLQSVTACDHPQKDRPREVQLWRDVMLQGISTSHPLVTIILILTDHHQHPTAYVFFSLLDYYSSKKILKKKKKTDLSLMVILGAVQPQIKVPNIYVCVSGKDSTA